MISYATLDELCLRYGDNTVLQLTDLERRGQINADIAQQALLDATAEIDGYLNRYTRPFPQIPRLLTVYCCDIAIYRLATGMRQGNDDMDTRYKHAIDYLKQVARGTATISGLPENGQLGTGDTVIFNQPQQKVFGRDRPY